MTFLHPSGCLYIKPSNRMIRHQNRRVYRSPCCIYISTMKVLLDPFKCCTASRLCRRRTHVYNIPTVSESPCSTFHSVWACSQSDCIDVERGLSSTSQAIAFRFRDQFFVSFFLLIVYVIITSAYYYWPSSPALCFYFSCKTCPMSPNGHELLGNQNH